MPVPNIGPPIKHKPESIYLILDIVPVQSVHAVAQIGQVLLLRLERGRVAAEPHHCRLTIQLDASDATKATE